MERGIAAYSRGLTQDPQFTYLDPGDRHYLRPPEARYRIALIGAGLNGRGHIKSAGIEGNSRIVGLYDPHTGSVTAGIEAARRYWPDQEPKVYPSIDDAVADSEVDGFMIATPNYTHREVLERVAGAGKPIFLEKPMATTIEDSAAMVRLQRETGVPIQVGLQYRFKTIYVEAIHEALKRRVLGNIKTLSIREHRIPFLDKVEQWNKFSKYSGGTLVEKCCHYFDLFNLFAEARPKRVIASGSRAVNYDGFDYRGERADIVDNASVIVEYENGIRATFDLCMFVPLFFEELVICGDGGRLRAFEQEDSLNDTGLQVGLEVYRGEGAPSWKSEPRYSGAVRETGHSGSDFYAHRIFMELLGGKDEHAPTVEEGYWSAVVGCAAEQSVRTGQPVEIDELLSLSDESRYW